MHKYKILGKKGEGTFSEVLRGQSVKNGKHVAIKCMKHTFDNLDQVNSLREIQALRRLSPHANVVKLYEVLYDQPSGRLALVFELMECNIYEMIKGRKQILPEAQVKNYMYQLVKAVDHMHRHGIFHRDIKPENLLVADGALKLADFGSCRGIHSRKPFTEYISTRWYRAPECLLTDGYYGAEMDMWGVGCVIFETLALFPLFPGANEADQIERIHKVLGTPHGETLEKMKKYGSTHVDWNFTQYPTRAEAIVKLLPQASAEAVDIVQRLLTYDPEKRLSAKDAIKHAWFAEAREMEARAKELAAKTSVAEGGDSGTSVSGTSPTSVPGRAPPPQPQTNATGGASGVAQSVQGGAALTTTVAPNSLAAAHNSTAAQKKAGAATGSAPVGVPGGAGGATTASAVAAAQSSSGPSAAAAVIQKSSGSTAGFGADSSLKAALANASRILQASDPGAGAGAGASASPTKGGTHIPPSPLKAATDALASNNLVAAQKYSMHAASGLSSAAGPSTTAAVGAASKAGYKSGAHVSASSYGSHDATHGSNDAAMRAAGVAASTQHGAGSIAAAAAAAAKIPMLTPLRVAGADSSASKPPGGVAAPGHSMSSMLTSVLSGGYSSSLGTSARTGAVQAAAKGTHLPPLPEVTHLDMGLINGSSHVHVGMSGSGNAAAAEAMRNLRLRAGSGAAAALPSQVGLPAPLSTQAAAPSASVMKEIAHALGARGDYLTATQETLVALSAAEHAAISSERERQRRIAGAGAPKAPSSLSPVSQQNAALQSMLSPSGAGGGSSMSWGLPHGAVGGLRHAPLPQQPALSPVGSKFAPQSNATTSQAQALAAKVPSTMVAPGKAPPVLQALPSYQSPTAAGGAAAAVLRPAHAGGMVSPTAGIAAAPAQLQAMRLAPMGLPPTKSVAGQISGILSPSASIASSSSVFASPLRAGAMHAASGSSGSSNADHSYATGAAAATAAAIATAAAARLVQPARARLEPLPAALSGSALKGFGAPAQGSTPNGSVPEGSGYMEHMRRRRQQYVSPYAQKSGAPGKLSAPLGFSSNFGLQGGSLATAYGVAAGAAQPVLGPPKRLR